ncbi:hypothetical protein PSN45_004777 [Yamadazyma tenuis]|uniref:Uncharacterized protein n=1 Tax=Candida tenuis (strain ATCC 10573 / BCRC 21748 / CBS 615 / JCM 9827 / NBRC 10315 / NRRL Y-1498 / VKM Y-70) TaxID=590646 RepID=G3B1K5_CANTC|nr:uncharacterized protein CANTEDRAFT_113236 [Yamadazyma tenuis ATCC 10573]XP_006685795.1 uncharacterized protein CANTEDRAFT_113236 [Yamadazyma tenuis ATCC 10573]EGV64988.1 hypothetical protein CANTEDRAFT_113236 [Yamadazyma tenuis ATCC 10573]EGV64989.1 hypothetical protein CANTEDRAFT_113236 [Yamadazyma tenuis ATCC 10573]WEJ97228.1 hypothetical protein PSN45_004777 [Yamadazyma tenuis]
MSENNQDSPKPTKSAVDMDPSDIYVKIGNKQVPFSSINKPHSVLLGPKHHKPQPPTEDFPDLTPAAKAREAELEEKKSS